MLWERVQIESDFLSGLCGCGPPVELIPREMAKCCLLYAECLIMSLKCSSNPSGCTDSTSQDLSLSLRSPAPSDSRNRFLTTTSTFVSPSLLCQPPLCAMPTPSSAARAQGPAFHCPTNVTWKMTVGITATKVTVVSALSQTCSPVLCKGRELSSVLGQDATHRHCFACLSCLTAASSHHLLGTGK